MNEPTREKLIEILVSDDLNITRFMDRLSYLYDILHNGFKGYSNYTNKELQEEFGKREKESRDKEHIKFTLPKIKEENKNV